MTMPPLTANSLRGALLVLAVLTGVSIQRATAANWPLTGYKSCGSQPLAGPWDDGTEFATADMAYDSDNNLLWLTEGLNLNLFRFSDGTLLSTYTFSSGGSGRRMLAEDTTPSLSVAAISGLRAAVVDGVEMKITIIASDGGALSVQKKIDLDFVPRTIAYDGAYELFYVTNAVDAASSQGSVAAGTQVLEVDASSGEDKGRVLFDLEDDKGIFKDFVVSSLHYASNTGTLFALCGSCPAIAEVTLSGRLRSPSSSFLAPPLLAAEPGELLSISFDRLGSPLLLLTKNLIVDQMCQDIQPSPPVLPPPKAAAQPPQTWYPLSNYFFCGASQYEEVAAGSFEAMALDPALRTMWAFVGGNLNEYSLRGALLRTISKEALEAEGVRGVTSMAWTKKNGLVLGMTVGNAIAVIDTAPPEAKDQILRISMAMAGISEEFSEELEPIGQDAEDSIIRDVNLFVVDSIFTIASDLLAPDSLGAVAYNTFPGKLLFSSTDPEAAGVKEISLDGQTGQVLLEGTALQVLRADVLVYSQTQDSFLMFDDFSATLTEVGREPEAVTSARVFDFFIIDKGQASMAAAMAVTPDGALLMIGTDDGEVTYYCGGPSEEEDDVVRAIRSGDDEDLDPSYYWRYRQLLVEEGEGEDEGGGVSVRAAFGDGLFLTKFGIACTDPDYYTYPIRLATRKECELICHDDSLCKAYNYAYADDTCTLKFSCNSEAFSLSIISGQKLSMPPPVETQVPTPSPGGGSDLTFIRLTNIKCSDAVQSVFASVPESTCEGLCQADASCVAYTFTAEGKCETKASCNTPVLSIGDVSGIKTGSGTSPKPTTPPPTNPPTTPKPPTPPKNPFVPYTELPGIGCEDETLGDFLSNMTLWRCKQACSANPECMAFTYSTKRMRCFLKATCNSQKKQDDNLTGYKPGLVFEKPTPRPTTRPPASPPASPPPGATPAPQASPPPPPPPPPSPPPPSPGGVPDSGKGAKLEDGWEHREGKNCEPWKDSRCGIADNPGLKIGDITWYRMFAHKANPLVNEGDGVMHWTPFREREDFGAMYHKGSEILGYFDEPVSVENEGDEAEVTFRWLSGGEIQDKICDGGSAKGFDCEKCGRDFEKKTGERYIYHEVRCFSGTGDIRVGWMDSTRAERINKDGYGYFNKKVLEMRGLQWRFHPHACPTTARDHPFGYAAVASQSWIRNMIVENWLNSHSMILDYIEKGSSSDWAPMLGESRSFKDRLMSPPENGACINAINGEWTPEGKEFKMYFKLLKKGAKESTFRWRYELNGFVQSSDETFENDKIPKTFDSIIVGYTNSRSYTTLKLQHVKTVVNGRRI